MTSKKTGKSGASGSGGYGAEFYDRQFSDLAKPTSVAKSRRGRRPIFPKSETPVEGELSLAAGDRSAGSENALKTPPLASRRGAAFADLKSILIHVESGDRAVPGLKVAADLARRSGALLIGIGAEALPPIAATDPFWSVDRSLIASLKEQVNANLRVAEATFNLYASEVRREWRTVDDEPTTAMVQASRAADLIMAYGSPNLDRYRSANPAELALLAGRPVLVAPPFAETLDAERVLVAWKDTREARRALADALPFLEAADDVIVLEICAKSDAKNAQFRVDDVANGLRRHGVKARGKVVTGDEARICDLISTEVKSAGSDLVVSGCYGHSRLNEWLFGGVTRELLARRDHFILMSH